ncbi:MAG TPA: 2-phospho-L-lactate guanylyltransferase [Nitrososphaeraceae archaeon]|nr:2-phospho-L-lactate guanylyltransferase [Nitrososphaeraceae archaeon]
MKTFAIVPVKRFDSAKSRLGMLLNKYERAQLSKLLVERTIHVLKGTSGIKKIVLVSSDVNVEKIADLYGATFLKEQIQRGVNSAVDKGTEFCTDSGAEATLVLPADLPLVIPEDIDIVCKAALTVRNCMVLCPSYKFDGSNIMLRKPCDIIKTSYDSRSYLTHVHEGVRNNIKARVLFIRRAMIDMDTIQDITNLLALGEMDEQIAECLRTSLARREL